MSSLTEPNLIDLIPRRRKYAIDVLSLLPIWAPVQSDGIYFTIRNFCLKQNMRELTYTLDLENLRRRVDKDLALR